MKFHLSFTKALVTLLFVLGFVLPATAEHTPPSASSLNHNIVDWWDEFDEDTYLNPAKSGMSDRKQPTNYAQDKMPHSQNQVVIDWWDEFEYQVPQDYASETPMTSKAQNSKQVLDEVWDWESWQSI